MAALLLQEKRMKSLKSMMISSGLVLDGDCGVVLDRSYFLTGSIPFFDDRCDAFIRGSFEFATEEVLVKLLLEERRARLNELSGALNILGCSDIGIGSSNKDHQSFSAVNRNLPDWGTEQASAQARFMFIEAGRGSAEAVAHIMAQFQRGCALVEALNTSGCSAWTMYEQCDASLSLIIWAGPNEHCNEFVLGHSKDGTSVECFVTALLELEEADPSSEIFKRPASELLYDYFDDYGWDGPDYAEYGGYDDSDSECDDNNSDA